MGEEGDKQSPAPQTPTREDDVNVNEETPTRAARKKKKVRRHRVSKKGGMGMVEEETDEEGESRKLAACIKRRQSQLVVAEKDIDDIPTLNYVSDDKKPALVVDDLDDLEHRKSETPTTEGDSEEEPEMTTEEKKAMYAAVVVGDIDLLEDCLDKPYSNINMVWFKDNLLMIAVKSKQQEMAEFLIDNGIDYNFKTNLISVKDEYSRDIECYTTNCRQLAFENRLHEIVELIDYLNGDLFPFIKPRVRFPRYRRPKPPTPEPSTGGESENDASSEASKDRSEDEGDNKPRKRKKKWSVSKEEGKNNEEETEAGFNDNVEDEELNSVKELPDNTDADSGQFSSGCLTETERDAEGSRMDSVDGLRRGSRAGSSRVRISSGRPSTRLTSAASSVARPPQSETFLRLFVRMSSASDEGYGSMSAKSSPTLSGRRRRGTMAAITISPRGTKSSLGMRQASLHRKALAEQGDKMPLLEQKVKLPGSYGIESLQWHNSNVHVCARSKKPVIEESDTTKMITPSRRIATQRKFASYPPGSAPVVSKSAGITISGSATAHSLSASAPTRSNATPSKTLPVRRHAHYMQMTTCAYTKRKLDPTFTKSYSALGFVSEKHSKPYNDFARTRTTPAINTDKHPSKQYSMGNLSNRFSSFNSKSIRNTSLAAQHQMVMRVW